MTVKEFRLLFTTELSDIYPKTEIDTFFFLLIEEKLGLQRIDIALQPEFEIKLDIFPHLETALERLKSNVPIQYIIGSTEFYGLPFIVNEHTLIPRPETEELVTWVLNDVNLEKSSQTQTKNPKPLTILEIGTGTGCIAIALAKNIPDATIFAIDISKDALKVAQQNAKQNQAQIEFIELDILKATNLPRHFDIIVSNPPYIRELEKEEIQSNVLDHEPHLALFVNNNNPLVFYKKIANLAKNHLTNKGSLYFEINQYLGKETVEMLIQKDFLNTELKKDIFGNDRMTKSSKN